MTIENTQKTTKKSKERPAGLKLIIFLGFLGSIFSLVAGLALIAFFASIATNPSVMEVLPAESLNPLSALIPLFAGVLGLVTYTLLWQLKKHGWYLAFVWGILNIANGLIAITVTQMISLLLTVIILAYLWKIRSIFE